VNPLPVRIEAWGYVLGPDGVINLVTGQHPWRGALPVMSDQDINAEALLLAAVDQGRPRVSHSTSWRQLLAPQPPALMLTYAQILHQPDFEDYDELYGMWPDAVPITFEAADYVGPPPPHGATERPQPRLVDVARHSLRHLAHLLATDAGVRGALAVGSIAHQWRIALRRLKPVLAKMYMPGDLPADEQWPGDQQLPAAA